MRRFNEREQKIIRQLVGYYSGNKNLNEINLFLTDEKVLGDDVVFVVCDNGEYIIYGKEEKRKDNLFTVVEILNLFRDLVDSRLIRIMPGDVRGLLFIGLIMNGGYDMKSNILFENGDYIKQGDICWYDCNDQMKYYPTTMSEQQFRIKDFIASVPLISPELEELVKNNFKTIEGKTLCITRLTAAVSFLAFVAAIIIPFVIPTKIDENQHEEYIRSIENLNQKILNVSDNKDDKINGSSYIMMNDTICN